MSRSRRKWPVLIAAGALVALGLAYATTFSGGPALAANATADRIVVRKAARTLTLYNQGQALKTYPISLGFGGAGPKRREGDGRTPEGLYSISGRNPDSVAHLALRVSYPEPRDVATAHAAGVQPGGDIMIHGMFNGFGWLGPLHRLVDWTAGCVAVTDGEMDEIWRATPDGVPIEFLP